MISVNCSQVRGAGNCY